MKLKHYLYSIFLLIAFNGCFGTNQPQAVKELPITIPAWYINPPHNNSTYLYGLGEATDMTSAQKVALENLLQRLSVEISSSSEYNLESYSDFREYTTKNTKQNITTSIKTLNIHDYEIKYSSQLSLDRYIVLVSVEKNKIIKLLQKDLDTIYDNVLLKKKNIEKQDPLTFKFFLEDSLQELANVNHKIAILENLNKNSNIKKYFNIQQNLTKELNNLNNTITVSINSDINSKAFINVIKNALIINGFKIDNNSNKNHIELFINSNTIENYAYGIHIAKTSLTLKVIYNDKQIAGNIINFKAASSNNIEDAKQNLIDKLQNILNIQKVFKR